MDKIIISPSKYVQGEQVLTSIAHYVKTLGERPLVIADEFVTNLVGDDVKQSFADEKLPLTMNILVANVRALRLNASRTFVRLKNMMSLSVLVVVKP